MTSLTQPDRDLALSIAEYSARLRDMELQMNNQLRAAHERGEHPTNAPYEHRLSVRTHVCQQSNGLFSVYISWSDGQRAGQKRVTVKGQPTPEEAMHDAQARWFA